jgi:alkylation response protein AidB-like acyl-CoA dehydrogenase
MEPETRYHPDREQLALVGEIEDSLSELLPLARLHKSREETAQTWEALFGLGLFGIALGEERGGVGLGAAEEALIVVGLGKRLAAPAVLATIGAMHALPDKSIGALDELPRAMAGYRHNGRILAVKDPAAQFLLLRDGDNAALYETGAAPQKAVDGRNWLANLCEFDGLNGPMTELGANEILRLRLLDAAALAGIAATATDMAVAYAGLREQFGRPIGSFQAVKHHCANMAIAARAARDQVSFAAVALDEGRADAALQIDSALYVAGTAALDNAGKNIQIHGGIGFSDEADPHLLVKRAQLQIAIAGGLEAATMRIANAAPIW